ncbi:hypothetical protein [uncultured Acinetobacter sp.]|uniref:hypothetical protein n=1 Tax=uncultured Acinetobacter sp. TaxID=165433 RepID=UPI0025825C65|nr:hypothetical protein [uncultured Acinetobacter sp.]
MHFSVGKNNFDRLNNNLLKNNALSGAENVGVEILEEGVPIKFNGETHQFKDLKVIHGKGFSKKFIARYKSTNKNFISGSIITSIDWNLVYN